MSTKDCKLSAKLHGVTYQTIVLFTSTAVRTSNFIFFNILQNFILINFIMAIYYYIPILSLLQEKLVRVYHVLSPLYKEVSVFCNKTFRNLLSFQHIDTLYYNNYFNSVIQIYNHVQIKWPTIAFPNPHTFPLSNEVLITTYRSKHVSL